MDDPAEFWSRSIAMLRGLTVDEAQANAWLLEQARDRWGSSVIARTSMHQLLFTMPGDDYPFDRFVRVSWAENVYEFRLQERLRPLITADRCSGPTAPSVLEAFLYQLAGPRAPDSPAGSQG